MKMEKSNIEPLTIDQAIKYVWSKVHKVSETKNTADEGSDQFKEQEAYLRESLAFCYKQLTFLNSAKEFLEKLAREKVRKETPYYE